jgi:DNA polymerase I
MTQKIESASFCALSEIRYEIFRTTSDGPRLCIALEELLKFEGHIGIDTETTGLDPINDRVRLIQIGAPEFCIIVDLDGFRPRGDARRVDWSLPGLEALKDFIEGPRPKVLQNAAFDLNFLRGEGLEITGHIYDTMFAAKIKNNGSSLPNNLGAIVNRELSEPLPKELQKANWAGEITDEMFKYAARDTCCLPRLIEPLTDKLKTSRVSQSVTLFDIFKLEAMCLRPISLMQWYGFKFDAEAAVELRLALVDEEADKKLFFLNALDEAIQRRHPKDQTKWLPRDPDGSFNTREKTKGSLRLGTKVYAGFNPRSNPQMAQKFEDAGILLPPNVKGLPSLDQNLLAFLRADYKLIDLYLQWKERATRVSHIDTLLEAVGPDGHIHAGYRQMGTDTGRLSCAEPNLQQIPREREFRSLFIAPGGWSLVVADFSQIELRVAAELSGEPLMLAAYRAGRDLHTETAALMTGKDQCDISKAERQSSKIANFGLLYGAGPSTLRRQAVAQYGIDMDMEEAKAIVSSFRKAYPRLYEWQQDQGGQTTVSVFTKYGRRRLMVGRNDKYTTRINTQVQGTAGDICKISIAMLYQRIHDKSNVVKLIATVHDELVLQVVDDQAEYWAAQLKECMEAAGALVCRKVPIVAEVSWGKSWADAK